MKKIQQDKKMIERSSMGEIATFLRHSTPEEVLRWTPSCSIEQLDAAITILKDTSLLDWKVKFDAFISGIEHVEGLEILGSSLNLEQLLEFIDFTKDHQDHAWKLVPVFIVLTHSLFNALLLNLPKERIQNLEYLCSTEPLQHHLLLFVHEINKLLNEDQNKFLNLQGEILQLDLSKLSSQEIVSIQAQIMQLRQQVQETCLKIEHALALAWKANHSELVDVLSNYRERYEKFLFSMVGHRGMTSKDSQGLFRLFEEQLATVYESSLNGDELEILNDADPAIDALAHLFVWYLEDYQQIGILPKNGDVGVKQDPEAQLSATQMSDYSKQVAHNLSCLGLKTVKDLKKNHLVSRSLLKEFISKHAAKIKI